MDPVEQQSVGPAEMKNVQVLGPRVVAIAGAVVGVFLLASCVSAQPEKATTLEQVLEQARAAGDEEAVDALSDLTVTRAEIDAATERMITCLASEGLRVVDNGINPFDGWRHELDIYWDGMSDADGQRSADLCQSKDFAFISEGYYLMNKDEIDPTLLPDILQCIQDQGITIPAGARSLRALLPLGGGDPNIDPVTACAQSVAEAQGFAAVSIVI